ncbi:DUF6825 domain-containing protein [Tumidithrix helvetica PCC 7403]|uniref:DUF6825 family protein n=1 Tax=Tumidithrix helvetica TaxID=3457545 RepID=UPI003C7F2852
MSNPLTRAFFIGRATAEALIDQVEDTLTDALSALGKFDAEQREKMRNFAETVLEKAAQQEGNVVSESGGSDPVDLQETIDNLRAEIAQLKSELQQHREENRI